jgi:hypothetical protein
MFVEPKESDIVMLCTNSNPSNCGFCMRIDAGWSVKTSIWLIQQKTSFTVSSRAKRI